MPAQPEPPAADAIAASVASRFRTRHATNPELVAVAPGRVNLIGEHTDYNGGFVLPMGIERHTAIAARRLGAGEASVARIYSVGLDAADAFGLEPDSRAARSLREGPHWSSYVRGVVAGCLALGWKLPPFEAVIETDIPLGGGLSSSAALEVAAITLLEALAGESLSGVEKTLLCQKAEHDFAGAPCGVMDQFTSLHARADALLLLDCRSLEARLTPMDDPAVTVLIVDSRVKHQLAGDDGAYARRRADCEAAARSLGVAALRDATLADLEAARDRLDSTAYRRARHVIGENGRTIAAAASAGQRDWQAVGQAMAASHESLRWDFEVSCRELDSLVAIAGELGEAAGVYGARMTGGGFGGCTVNLVRTDAAENIARQIAARYERAIGLRPEIFCTRPASGARLAPAAAFLDG